MTSPAPLPLIETILGCLLHDIGKPVQRAELGYRGTHSAIGRAFLKKAWLGDARNPSEFIGEANESTVADRDRHVLDAVSFHHGAALRAATVHGRLEPDAPAYITYIADNIAAGTDRRKADVDDEDAPQWDRDTPLFSVFNRFGQGTQHLRFRPELLDDREPLNVAVDTDFTFDKYRYTEIVEKLRSELAHLDRTEAFVSSLLNVLEATLSFVPSSTDASEVVDISLFDHLKLTAAFGSCIWHVLDADGDSDYKSTLFDGQEVFYDRDAFLLATFDLSGIQNFIYTIHSSGAARMLRSRSFYLEMLTEHLVDELLSRLALTRANLNYSGGGHAYLLLPNTPQTRDTLAAFERDTNAWLLSQVGPRLFMATGSAPLSARDVMRKQGESADEAAERADRYAGLYRQMSGQVSAKKLARYDAAHIQALNDSRPESGRRECQVCHDVQPGISADGLCLLCDRLNAVSRRIQSDGHPYLVIRDGGDGLPLPYDRTLSFEDRSSALVTLDDPATIRVYAKNKFHVGELQGTRLWVGDYFAQRKFSAYASAAGGISRLGVLRLDVDNLGQAFTRGFMAQGSGTYNTISRTAAFSRMLSMFFRQHINYLLEKPKFRPITGGVDRPRRASIIYSGGDDLFVVGAWDDVVELAIEVRDRFTDYVQGKLTVSAGIGMFPNKYPVSVMARETGDLESAAKALPTKDALALFDTDLVFDWDTLRDEIIEVKYRRIADFFAGNQERGAAFIYRLLGLLSDWDDPMSLVHWVYLLSRLRDVSDDGPAFKVFSDQLHRWFSTERDKKQLRVALYLYMYANRDEKKGK